MLDAAIKALQQAEPAIMSLVVAWLTAWISYYIRTHLKLNNALLVQTLNDTLTDAIVRGSKLADVAAIQGLQRLDGPINTGNKRVNIVANYVASMNPDLLKKLGVDVTDPQGAVNLVKRVVATLPMPPLNPPVQAG